MKMRDLRTQLLGLFPCGAFVLGLLGALALMADGTPLTTGTVTAVLMCAAVLCILCQIFLTHRYYRCPKCGKVLSGQRAIPIAPKHCPDCGCEIDYETMISFRKES